MILHKPTSVRFSEGYPYISRNKDVARFMCTHHFSRGIVDGLEIRVPDVLPEGSSM